MAAVPDTDKLVLFDRYAAVARSLDVAITAATPAQPKAGALTASHAI